MGEGKRDLSLLKVSSMMIAIALLLCVLVVGLNRLSDSGGWFRLLFPVVMIPLVLGGSGILLFVTAVALLSLESSTEKERAKLLKEGITTTATVIHSHPCSDPEDVCMCGSYSYQDQTGQSYEHEFRVCIHWPSKEQWGEVERLYAKGATSIVTYLPSDPGTHSYLAEGFGPIMGRATRVEKSD